MSPMRLGLLLLTTVLCLGVFMLSLLDNMTLADLGRTASANEYASNWVKSWQGKPFEEIRQLAQSEIDRLVDVQVWYYGSDFYVPPFETEDEAIAYIADLPDLVDAVRRRNNNDFADTLDVYWEAMWAIRDEANYLAGYGDYLTGIQSQAKIQSQTISSLESPAAFQGATSPKQRRTLRIFSVFKWSLATAGVSSGGLISSWVIISTSLSLPLSLCHSWRSGGAGCGRSFALPAADAADWVLHG